MSDEMQEKSSNHNTPNTEEYGILRQIALKDVEIIQEKEKTYRGSWKSRGGIGAFMMAARKWDRLENIVSEYASKPGYGTAEKYDVFAHAMLNPALVLDQIRDLRCYLLLIEGEVLEQISTPPTPVDRDLFST